MNEQQDTRNVDQNRTSYIRLIKSIAKPSSRTKPLLNAQIEALDRQIDTHDTDNEQKENIKKHIKKILEDARNMIKNLDMENDKGEDWGEEEDNKVKLAVKHLLLEARVCEIGIMNDKDQQIRMQMLSSEIRERLIGWRQEAASELLKSDDEVRFRLLSNSHEYNELMETRVERFRASLRLVHEADVEAYYRKILIRDNLRIFMLYMVVFIPSFIAALTFGIAVPDIPDPTAGVAISDISLRRMMMPVECALAGGIGACLSGLLTMTSTDYIPDLNTSRIVTHVRSFIGLASGLVAYLLVEAGIVPLRPEPVAALALAFAVGFSERYFLGAISKAEPGQQGGVLT